MNVKMKMLVAVAGMMAAQSALAADGATEQRLIDQGFLPAPIEATEFVRGVPAEPESRTEALLVEWGFKPQPMERQLRTEQRRVADPLPEGAVDRTLVESGFLPMPLRNVSTLVEVDHRETGAGS